MTTYFYKPTDYVEAEVSYLAEPFISDDADEEEYWQFLENYNSLYKDGKIQEAHQLAFAFLRKIFPRQLERIIADLKSRPLADGGNS